MLAIQQLGPSTAGVDRCAGIAVLVRWHSSGHRDYFILPSCDVAHGPDSSRRAVRCLRQVSALTALAEGGALHLLPGLGASPGGPPAYLCGTGMPGDPEGGVAELPPEVLTQLIMLHP